MEAVMLLYVLVFTGGAMLYQQVRAGRRGELTSKLAVSTLLGVVAVYPAAFGVPLQYGPILGWAAIASLLWFAMLPLAGRTLGRRRPVLGRTLEELAIWGSRGREQAAIMRAALALATEEPDNAIAMLEGIEDDEARSYRVIACAMAGRWDEVLRLPSDAGQGPQNLHVRGARVAALAQTHRLAEARQELDEMRRMKIDGLDEATQSSFVLLGELEIAAATGDAGAAYTVLQSPLPQTRAAYILWRFGQALERAGHSNDAIGAWRQAWERLSPAQRLTRARIEESLQSAGEEIPRPVHVQLAHPWATSAVVGGIALAYLAQVTIQSSLGPSAPFELGAFVIPLREGEPWRLFSYALVHAGLIHAGMNAWVMWDVGRILERRSGPASVAGSFVFGTVGGSLLSAVMMGEGGLVGASGGVLGVGGSLLVNAYLRSAKEGTQLFRGVGTWLVIIMAFSVLFPNVSIWGHLGGIIAGAAFGFVFDRTRSRVVDVGVLVASVGVFAWTIMEMAALATG